MVDIIEALEIYPENASQMVQKIESLRVKIYELDRWRNIEKNDPGGLLGIKSYDIRLHTLVTNACQELASKFKEKVQKRLIVIIKVYTELLKRFKRIFKGLRSIFKMNN